MTDASNGRPQRPWTRWLVIAAGVLVGLLLYPQLMDFGSEIYRLFAS